MYQSLKWNRAGKKMGKCSSTCHDLTGKLGKAVFNSAFVLEFFLTFKRKWCLNKHDFGFKIIWTLTSSYSVRLITLLIISSFYTKGRYVIFIKIDPLLKPRGRAHHPGPILSRSQSCSPKPWSSIFLSLISLLPTSKQLICLQALRCLECLTLL